MRMSYAYVALSMIGPRDELNDMLYSDQMIRWRFYSALLPL
jgi:hypothetical protein